MKLGSIRAILLFMIFIVEYISRFLPKGEDEEPEAGEKKAKEEELDARIFPAF